MASFGQKLENDLYGDLEFVMQISQMDTRALLRLVVDSPEYLTDYYYRGIGGAIVERARQLLERDGHVDP